MSNKPTPSWFRENMNDSEFADAYVKEHLLLDWEAMIERAAKVLKSLGLPYLPGAAEQVLRAALEVSDVE